MDHKDYYKIMSLSRDASPQDIKIAYRRLARQYHPDVSKDPQAEEKFKTLGEAYEVLKNPDKKKTYDDYLRQVEQSPPGSQGGPFDWQHASQGQQRAYSSYQWDGEHPEINESTLGPEFFEFLFGQRPQSWQNAPGVPVEGSIHISLHEAYHGVTKDIQITTPGNQSQTLRVKIPAGIKEGQKIRLAGQGASGQTGGAKGDLFVTIHINKDSQFDVLQQDVYFTLPITPWEAALGTTLSVPTLGGPVELKIPSGSQGGQKLRLKHRGLPGKEPGDQYIILKIVIPKPITEEAKALYQKMAEAIPFDPRHEK